MAVKKAAQAGVRGLCVNGSLPFSGQMLRSGCGHTWPRGRPFCKGTWAVTGAGCGPPSEEPGWFGESKDAKDVNTHAGCCGKARSSRLPTFTPAWSPPPNCDNRPCLWAGSASRAGGIYTHALPLVTRRFPSPAAEGSSPCHKAANASTERR